MNKYKNLIHALSSYRNSATGVRFIHDRDDETFLSYKDLYQNALNVLANLRKLNIKKGDKLIIQVEDNEFFLTLFWACLMGKIIPVPLTVAGNNKLKLKLIQVWKVLENPYMVCDKKIFDDIKKYLVKNKYDDLFHKMEKQTFFNETFQTETDHGEPEDPDLDDIAYIQFSSSSTREPKGIL